jgi:FAD/FMN-containing dehydrogenase
MAVALPTEVDDLLHLIRFVREEGLGLIPRGAGSGMPGNNVGRGILVDLQAFNRPLFVTANHTANAGASITWAELQRAAAHLNLRLPPDPSSGAFCTLGGMVAANAAGARSLKYGSVRKWVRGVEFVTADCDVAWVPRGPGQRIAREPGRRQRQLLATEFGARTRFERDVRSLILDAEEAVAARFPKTRKNSSGYALDAYLASGDLLDLIIGSEGTLGIVTRIELELATQPAARSTVLLALNNLGDLADVTTHLLGLDPSACELLDRTILTLAAIPDLTLSGVEGILLVEFERSNAAAARRVAGDAVRGTRPWCAYAKTGLTDEQSHELWAVRRAASAALANLPPTRRSLQIIEDSCVPVEHLGDYVAAVRATASRLGIEIAAFGHAGDGHLHVNTLVDTTQPEFEQRLEALLDEVVDVVNRLGGTLSGEHGDGCLRAPLLERLYGRAIVDLFHSVKTAFDPCGIFNPGVIVSEITAAPIKHLKIGGSASPIPAEIAERLTAMERGKDWGRSKLDIVEDALRAGAEPTSVEVTQS